MPYLCLLFIKIKISKLNRKSQAQDMTIGMFERAANAIISFIGLPNGLTNLETDQINIYEAAGDSFAAHRLRV